MLNQKKGKYKESKILKRKKKKKKMEWKMEMK